MAKFLPFSSATINLDNVTHLTRNNMSLVFHLTSGNMIQVGAPGYWTKDELQKFLRDPERTVVQLDDRLKPQ